MRASRVILRNLDFPERNYALMYNSHGDPKQVLKCEMLNLDSQRPKIENHKLRSLQPNILLKFIASPINPSDINQIQGTYPIRPEFPNAIAGNEGLAKVVHSDDHRFPEGTRVIPLESSFGTWRHYAYASSDQLIRVPDQVPSLEAAVLSVNICTAYRLLHDFGQLESGDSIIQNASNSGVGRAVIQLCHSLGYKSVCVIRDRMENRNETPDKQANTVLKQDLYDLGASMVITQSELEKREVRHEIIAKYQPKLGFNGVSGKSVADMSKVLSENSSIITYGGMSKQPLTIPISQLIFRGVKFEGFWMAKWKQRNVFLENNARKMSFDYIQMMGEIFKLLSNKQLKAPPVKLCPWLSGMSQNQLDESFHKALLETQSGGYGKKKQVLVMDAVELD